jgi:hypothetical protein
MKFVNITEVEIWTELGCTNDHNPPYTLHIGYDVQLNMY